MQYEIKQKYVKIQCKHKRHEDSYKSSLILYIFRL